MSRMSIFVVTFLAMVWPMKVLAADQHHQDGIQHHESFSAGHTTKNKHERKGKDDHDKGQGERSPRLTLPPDVTIEATGLLSVVNLGMATAVDEDGRSLPVSNDAPTAFPVGSTTVTYKATDEDGHTATGTQLVTVQDTTPPTIAAPASVSADSITGQPIPVSIGTATATDIFGPVSVTNDSPATFPIGVTTVTWTATDTHGNRATAMQTVTVNDTSVLANLPPDPGPAGEATLAGIDSDNDGVRDDVQRWIAINYPNSQKTRLALVQETKAMQAILLDAADPVKSYDDAREDIRAIQCLSYIRPDDSYRVLAEHKAIFLNTRLRSRAWLQANHNLSGKFFGLLKSPIQGCDFNPYAMPN